MLIMVHPGTRVINTISTDDSLVVELDYILCFCSSRWHPRLLDASRKEHDYRQSAGGGFGIFWPAIDEVLSVDGSSLRGASAQRIRVTSS